MNTPSNNIENQEVVSQKRDDFDEIQDSDEQETVKKWKKIVAERNKAKKEQEGKTEELKQELEVCDNDRTSNKNSRTEAPKNNRTEAPKNNRTDNKNTRKKDWEYLSTEKESKQTKKKFRQRIKNIINFSRLKKKKPEQEKPIEKKKKDNKNTVEEIKGLEEIEAYGLYEDTFEEIVEKIIKGEKIQGERYSKAMERWFQNSGNSFKGEKLIEVFKMLIEEKGYELKVIDKNEFPWPHVKWPGEYCIVINKRTKKEQKIVITPTKNPVIFEREPASLEK